jgi:hypothetical protein
MSGIVYPSGPQALRIPTTILLPSTATPFNPSAVNPSTEACFDGIKALENYGLFKSTFDAAQPPYPGGGSFVNAGTYRLSTGSILTFSAAKLYVRVAHPLANYDPTYWTDRRTNTPTPLGSFLQSALVGGFPNNTFAIRYGFDLPDQIILKRAGFRVEPVGGHAALPEFMPHIRIVITDSVTGVTVNHLGTDGSANVATYQAPHVVSVTLPDIAFDAGRHSVIALIRGEDGANADILLEAYVPFIEYERTVIGQEFGATVP